MPRFGVPDLAQFSNGTHEYPDRSATLVIQAEQLRSDLGVTLRGPGIQSEHRLGIAALGAEFWQQMIASRHDFPLGIDVVFVGPGTIAALAPLHPDPSDGDRLMYVAVKGGEKAIDAAHRLLAEERRGDPAVPELTLEQIAEQLTLAVDRVMTEGSLYDRELAALAIKQARGDLIEAIFLLRAARTTLARFGYAEPLETSAMRIRRRISAAFKDIPGGQILGPTFDYTHRLLDSGLPTTTPADAAARRRRLRQRSAHGARPSRRRRPDRAAAAGLPTRARRSHPGSARLSGRPRSAAAKPGARR